MLDQDDMKADMIDMFEELYANAKMEILAGDSEPASVRQLVGQVQGFFIAMKIAVPLDMEEVVYVENRLKMLEDRMH